MIRPGPQAPLRKLVLTDHELPFLSSLNAVPTLEHAVIAGSFRLQVDAVETRLPLLRTLALVDTYQEAPEQLPPDLFAALPALERLTVSQSADHLPRVWAVRLHLDPRRIDERLVQPTLEFGDAVLDCPTIPTGASFMYRTAVQARQSAKKYLFPAALVYKAAVSRAKGRVRAATVTVVPRQAA